MIANFIAYPSGRHAGRLWLQMTDEPSQEARKGERHMPVERIEHSDARSMMKPGDVIAFGGKGHFSELIKFATRADVSPVGAILETFDSVSFYNFLFNQARDRKGYDVPQALKSAIDALDELPFGLHGPGYNREDFSRFFCSELVAAGLEKAGTVGSVNASEVTPIDLCRWKIYAKTYFQLKGEVDKEISRYNAMDPAAWKV